MLLHLHDNERHVNHKVVFLDYKSLNVYHQSRHKFGIDILKQLPITYNINKADGVLVNKTYTGCPIRA